MDEKKFRIRVKLKKRFPGYTAPGSWDEPVEAVEYAERVLRTSGVVGESFVEVMFNGDPEPHMVVGFLGDDRFSLFNTKSSRWPVYYPEGTAAFKDMLMELPEWMQSKPDDFNNGPAPGDGDGDAEEEKPMRLPLFSKMRGPSGWRKRAEANPEKKENQFHFRWGWLDERFRGRSAERVLVSVVITEQDSNRKDANLVITLPPGVELNRIGGTRSYNARIPYPDQT